MYLGAGENLEKICTDYISFKYSISGMSIDSLKGFAKELTWNSHLLRERCRTLQD